MTSVYEQLNKDWKSTCKILFGEDIGDLKEFDPWLREFYPTVHKRKSYLSGKEVSLLMDDYCGDANFISMDESKETTIDPLTINEVKDVDSILEAVSEKWRYTGNRALGNSTSVESSDLIMDSQYIGECMSLTRASHAYLTFDALDFKYAFGSGFFSQDCEFLVKHLRGSNDKRCFSTVYVQDSSDLYLSMHCYGCHDLLFSFNQRNKRNMIGNLELPKDKYQEVKTKLLSEIKTELKKNKKFPSLFDLVSTEPLDKSISVSISSDDKKEDMTPIEKAFLSTFKVIFKRDASSLADYERWLTKRTVPLKEYTSPFGSPVYLPASHQSFRIFDIFPKERLVTYGEAMELGTISMSEEHIANIERIKEWVSKTCCFPTEFYHGEFSNTIKSPVILNSSNVYKSYTAVRAEYTGITSWPIQSKYVFGCHWVTDSQYCLKSYNSLALTRCFEVDTSTRCTDTFFSHDSEGLTDCMFCFGAKGKRYAIGNASTQPDKYKSIKSSILQQLGDELESNKDLKWDIFNIGCYKS